ncbi:hypothetical protein [Antarcticirhabdus aurantiaca]|uniref:Uncharacterized protein n=1 Tax=Antarcticirhabdus aurantiaca TaxID=2606717 RepID=A0ACD4NRH9_9HYPH|nr:hypothetical protein [Antarcticirhabdus aurantiaca]WAJ29374.1 hypothetical protein OXU80_03815 [Jeongeuplla avenae]
MSVEPLRRGLAAHALAVVPRILTLQDRTATSPTFGCFDRNYWHYRIIDFPCGMSQEFVLPLALAYAADVPDNPYFRSEAIREWAVAGMRYAARSAHPDGSCDDYFPFERAAGAAAFSLFAILESLDVLGIGPDAEIDGLVRRRAAWLAAHEESGRLSNHEALIANGLERAARRLAEPAFEAAMHRRLARLRSWQSGEGWFDEYGGADLGYLSLTIGLLADLDRRRPDLALREPLARAIGFFRHFVHCDGSVGGEYSSRSTLNFFPHGFEIAGAWMPEALAVNDAALPRVVAGLGPTCEDDHILAHHVWSWLLTVREMVPERPAPARPPQGRTSFPEAGLLVERRESVELVVSTAKGGTFRLFRNGRLVRSDTGAALATTDGRAAVCHIVGPFETTIDGDAITVAGAMAYAKSALLTPLKNVVLRLVMLSLGRFFPDLVRRLLQKLLVTGRRDAPFRFRRALTLEPSGAVLLRDEISAAEGWDGVALIGRGHSQVSITTIMARVFQPSQLEPFDDWTARLAGLGPAEPLVVETRL